MADKMTIRHQSGKAGALGPLWVMGWLFSIGFLHLSFWKGLLAIILWPYYLGVFFHH